MNGEVLSWNRENTDGWNIPARVSTISCIKYWAKFLPGTQLFLKQHEQILATMPVAVFALSTYADEETKIVYQETKEFFVDKELEKVPAVQPVGEVGLFGGAFTLQKLFPIEVFSMKLEGYSDRDYLNEAVVISWSETLCGLFE